jgi:Hsp20/alpha crystallin family
VGHDPAAAPDLITRQGGSRSRREVALYYAAAEAGSTLTVHGERRVKGGCYVSRRRFTGAFEKQFRIGEGYDLDRVDARIANGVLTITLSKVEKAKPRRIKLGSGIVDKVKGLLSGDKETTSSPLRDAAVHAPREAVT